MPTWPEAAEWYLDMVGDPTRGFNDLAGDTCMRLLGDVNSRDVLDIGCGEGHIARRLARTGARVQAVDPVLTFLNAALEADRREPLGLSHRQDSAEKLATVATRSVDLACAVLVLHHVPDLAAAMAEIHRVPAAITPPRPGPKPPTASAEPSVTTAPKAPGPAAPPAPAATSPRCETSGGTTTPSAPG